MITRESSVQIAKPLEEVFSFVSNPTNEPRWHTDVQEVASPSEGVQLGTRMTWTLSFMGRRDMELEVVDFVPNQREQLQAQGPMMGMKPTITYLFERSGAGTKFTRRVDMELTGAWKLMTPMAGTMVRKRNAGFAENLKKTLET